MYRVTVAVAVTSADGQFVSQSRQDAPNAILLDSAIRVAASAATLDVLRQVLAELEKYLPKKSDPGKDG